MFCPGGDPRTPWNTGMPSDEQPVTNIGLAYQAALYTGTAATLGFLASDYVITRPARDWVMGYEDPTLVAAQPTHPTIVRSSTVSPLQHNLSAPTQTAWARPSNGTMQVWTGASSSLGFAGYMSRVQNDANAQVCHSLTAEQDVPECKDAWPCPEDMDCPDVEPIVPDQAEGSQLGYINGSTGQRFPWQPGFSTFSGTLDCRHNLSLWLPCLLRTVTLYCDVAARPFSVSATPIADIEFEEGDETGSEIEVEARLFRIAAEDAMPASEHPFNAAYDMHGNSPWIWNMSAARQAPIFMSLPQFANSTFELNTTTKSSASNVQGLRAPDFYSFSWLGIEVYSGVRLRGAIRLQTNVLVSGPTAAWSEPWMVPIGRISYENNATNHTIDTIHGLAYGTLTQLAAKAIQVVFFILATIFLSLSVGFGVKYWEMQRGLVKMKKKSLSRSGAAASFVRRACLRCGLCGPDRGHIVRRLQEMKQEELLSPLLGGGQSLTPRAQIQEKEFKATPSTGRRRAATDDDRIEVHFGQLEQMSSDESEVDEAILSENVHVVTKLDPETWHDLVTPPGRSRLQRCYILLELMPWVCWWVFGIFPKWFFAQSTLSSAWLLHGWLFNETRALVLAAFISVVVVSAQILQRLCTAKMDRVFVLVPTVVDISTMLVFCISAATAKFAEHQSWSSWPAITHGSMLVTAILCVIFDHPFIISVYCRELRPEIWRERIVFQLSQVVSWFWCIILFLVTVLQIIPVLAPHNMNPAEKAWLIAAIPVALLVCTLFFTIWYSMQVEEEFVRALNRLLRRGILRSRRDGTPHVDAPPTPTNVARPQPPADTSMDVHVVPTLSPRNTLSNSETDDSPFSSFLSATGSSDGPEQESPSRSRIPELTLQTSVEAPAPMPVPAAVAAAAAATSASTESIGASVEVQAAAPAPEPQQVPTTPERVGDTDRHAPDTVERASSDEIERKAAEIQESVSWHLLACFMFMLRLDFKCVQLVRNNRWRLRWRNRLQYLRSCSMRQVLTRSRQLPDGR